jgi:hypothetical protein
VPVRFDLGPEGVTETVLGRRRRIAWRKVAEFALKRRGVMLYPFPEERRRFAPRSMYIRGGRQRDRLVEVVSFYVGSQTPRRSSSSVRRTTPPAAAVAAENTAPAAPSPPVTQTAPQSR